MMWKKDKKCGVVEEPEEMDGHKGIFLFVSDTAGQQNI